MDCRKKTCDSNRKTSHKDHKTGFQGNISNTAAQAEGYGAAVDLNGTRYFSRETAFPLTWLEESFSSVMAPSR